MKVTLQTEVVYLQF